MAKAGKINGKWMVENQYGEMVPGKLRIFETFGIRWETVSGEWLPKVKAIREGIKLTGKKVRMHTGHSNIVVPV